MLSKLEMLIKSEMLGKLEKIRIMSEVALSSDLDKKMLEWTLKEILKEIESEENK